AALLPGNHLVEIGMEGYGHWSENVEITADTDHQITAVLKQLTGSLNIKSEPANAMIIVDGKEVGNTPASIAALLPGNHLVEIGMEGYEKWSDSVEITADKEHQITAVLKQLTGSLEIKSKPENAMIIVDGKEVGNTPATITALLPGNHLVEIGMEGYEKWSESVAISVDKQNQITAVLKQLTGSLDIKSEPADAMIIVDGKEVGNTPASITALLPGNHLVEIRMEGYGHWSESVEITADKEHQITAVLKQLAGSLDIKSEPENAMIIVDGKEVGNTPASIAALLPGNHLVEVRMEGYGHWSESVEITADKEHQITAVLKQLTGSLDIKSEPADAMIIVDGKEVGNTPATITALLPGKHLVEIGMEGYGHWSESIDVRGGMENTLNAKLLKITGSIDIKSNPPEATIYLDGEKIATTPDTLQSVAIGIHEVEIKMEGYAEWKKTINVKKGKEITLIATLQLNTGTVGIESDPAEAIVFLDGKEVGNSPVSLTGIKIGIYEVELKKEGYVSWKETIKIKAGRVNSLTAKLTEMPAAININSEPSNAMILIDSKKAGSTPKTLTGIKPGMHQVEVSMDGYEKWSESVEVINDKENTITAVLLAITGSISMKSNPSEATIFLDGKEIGTTPDTIKPVAIGTHEIEVKKDGHAEWKKKLKMKKGTEITLNALLQPVTGTARFESEPTGALIFLDDENVGSTPKVMTGINTGKHKVEFRLEGYSSYLQMIKIKAGRESAFTATLQIKRGSLMVISNPPNATIYIQGRKLGKTPKTISELVPGNYAVEVKLDEYRTWSESVDVEPDKETTLKAVLQAKPGSISIKSEPSDAKILIDGNEAGTTPKTINEIESGLHVVKVIVEGYDVWSENVEVKPDKEFYLTAVLRQMTGSINVKSEPENATILINGSKVGTTPETIENLKPGFYQVEVINGGFENWSNNVEVTAEKQSAVTALLQKASGSIKIKSTPLNAKIYINGEEAGTTPATLSSVPIGTHEIEVKIDGHGDWKKTIIIKKDKRMDLNAVLQLNIGSISIESYPENAKINLDGKNVGNAPKRLTDIIVGTHEVELLLDGYDTWKKTIKVKAEKEISLTADLKETDDTKEIKADQAKKISETAETTAQEIPEIELKPEKIPEKLIPQPPGTDSSSSDKKSKYSPDKLIKLRSTYNKISDSEIESLPYITINEKNNNIFFCHSTINHRYELKPIGDGEVVIDHTTELMWHQSGSSEYFNLRKANKWLKKTNKNSYAGFNDWRLPTLEEASTLLEFGTKSGKFIHSVFDDKQWGTWTGDKSDKGRGWIVTYVNGTISQVHVGTPATFVRPVRSINL
ncbi:MAG: PEGA domain-containing protein, partial [Candidatus Scalindua rubra]|nr:PEGA domain-containing protein [Candidatus Scalindua rubra]